jgi:pimeloyl-ACP methyl ester carboxylesterase
MSLIFALWLAIASVTAFSAPQSAPVLNAPYPFSDSFPEGLAEFAAYRTDRSRTISHPELHGPVLLHHGRKTEYVVIFASGLFESPQFNQSLYSTFFHRGMNVLVPTLPGNWMNPADLANESTVDDILADQRRTFAIAQKLGQKILLAGFSLGGLYAVYGTLSHPELVHGLLLWAPALGYAPLGKIAYGAAAFAHQWIKWISGNDFLRQPSDGKTVPFISTNGPVLVYRLQQRLFSEFAHVLPPEWSDYLDLRFSPLAYRRIKVPLFVVYSQADQLISANEIDRLFHYARGPKARIRYRNVSHNALPKSEWDTRSFYRPKEWNQDWPQMQGRLLEFLQVNFPVTSPAEEEFHSLSIGALP